MHFSHTLIVAALALSPFAASAQTAEEKGLAIAKQAEQRDTGWQDSSADMRMTLENRAGKKSTRSISSRTLEVSGDGDKSLSLFREPRDVAGTAMLTFAHGLEPDDQWLFLPALKRVKRISSKNKSGPFMGSEFAFEDLGSQEVEKYSYKYIVEEGCGEAMTCHVLERIPAYQHSGYSKQKVWMDTAQFRNIKVEYYDRKDKLLKTLTTKGYKEYDGYWRADTIFMENHQTGKKTTLDWSNYQLKTGAISESDFNKNALSRIR